MSEGDLIRVNLIVEMKFIAITKLAKLKLHCDHYRSQDALGSVL